MNIDSYSFKNYNKKEEKDNKSFFSKFLFTILVKTLVVIALFLGSLIYIRKDTKNKNLFKKIVYQNSLSFARIYDVYQKYLGDVIPFKNIFKDNTKIVSSEKLSYKNIEKENDGYLLTVSSDYALSALKSGIITEIKKDDKYKNLIKIQDKNGVNITYGYVDDLNVKLYDYVKKGEVIGKVNNKLYLIFEKGGNYLSYKKYL